MRSIQIASSVAAILLCVGRTEAKPFVGESSAPTLRGIAAEAQVILFGRFESPKFIGRMGQGETDFIVHAVLRDHPTIKDRKVFKVPRYIPARENGDANYFLIFGDIYKERLEFYSGYQANAQVLSYMRDILKLDSHKPVEALRYYLDRLDATDEVIATDVYRELDRASDDVRRDAARTLTPAKLWPVLRDENVQLSRRNDVALLMAHCGKQADADELWKLFESTRSPEGMYFAVLTLNAKDYAAKVQAVAKDEKATFVRRLSIWRATKRLIETKSKALTENELSALTVTFLDQSDMADFPIRALTQWKRWEHTERILSNQGKDRFKEPVLRNAVIRYALECPLPVAKAFLETMRKEDPDWVRLLEEERNQ